MWCLFRGSCERRCKSGFQSEPVAENLHLIVKVTPCIVSFIHFLQTDHVSACSLNDVSNPLEIVPTVHTLGPVDVVRDYREISIH